MLQSESSRGEGGVSSENFSQEDDIQNQLKKSKRQSLRILSKSVTHQSRVNEISSPRIGFEEGGNLLQSLRSEAPIPRPTTTSDPRGNIHRKAIDSEGSIPHGISL